MNTETSTLHGRGGFSLAGFAFTANAIAMCLFYSWTGAQSNHFMLTLMLLALQVTYWLHYAAKNRSEIAHIAFLQDATKSVLQLLAILIGTLALYASAKIQVPMYPVPMTMQTAVVMALPMLFGWLGVAMVATYLLEGLLGLPVFASGGGAAYFLGPSGGYLVGFLLAALAVVWLLQKLSTVGFLERVLIGMAVTWIVLFSGTAYLTYLIGFKEAVLGGFVPFFVGEMIRAVCVAPIITAVINQEQKTKSTA